MGRYIKDRPDLASPLSLKDRNELLLETRILVHFGSQVGSKAKAGVVLAGGEKHVPNVVVGGERRFRPCSAVVAVHAAHLVVVFIRVLWTGVRCNTGILGRMPIHISFGNTVVLERKVPGKGST